MRDKSKLHGFFRLEVKNNGKILKDTGWIPNIITNAALAELSGLAGNTGSKTAFTYLAVGTDNTAAAVTQTALQAEITDSGLARAAATVSQETTTVTDDTLQLTYTWTATASKTIEEAGIFNAASNGTMLARALTGSTAVVNGNEVVLTYKVSFADDGV